MEATTDLFGIPVPSTSPVFLTFVVVHIIISLACVVSGLLAMFAIKGGKRHSIYGKVYFWSMLSAFATIVILSAMRWPHNIHLLSIGTLAVSSVYLGWRLAKNQKKNWTRLHTILMGSSYIFLMTGFLRRQWKEPSPVETISAMVLLGFPSRSWHTYNSESTENASVESE
jgi:uncharacterized membrane protein